MPGCIAGCQYMPSAEFFAHWLHHGHMTIEACEHYQKRTWRNRTGIQGKDNPIYLTVPLKKGKHQALDIQKVEISYDEPWQKQHLESIRTAYGKTPFLDEVLPELEIVYQQQHTTLWSFNIDMIQLIISLLGGTWNYHFTDNFVKDYQSSLTDLRGGVPCGIKKLGSNEIPSYPQVQRLGRSHQPNLCILDALCHLGPETNGYLRRYAKALYTEVS